VKKGEGAKNKRAERRGAKYSNKKPAGVTKRSSDPKKKKPIIKTDGKFAGKSKEDGKEGKGKDSAPQDDQKKTYNKPNGDLIQDLVLEWEKSRSTKVSDEDRKKVLSDMAKRVNGKVMELGTNHKASRIIQAIIKLGTPTEKANLFAEISNADSILHLSRSSYGHFVVKSLLEGTPKKDMTKMLANFRGKVVTLARHPCGAGVLEVAYSLANSVQRSALVAEFYGPEFALKAHGAIVKGGAGLTLQDALADPQLGGRMAVIAHASRVLAGVWEKGMVTPAFMHRVLSEYLQVAPASMIREAADSLAGDQALVRMMHTLDGVKAVNIIVQYANNKERKKIVKSLKGVVRKLSEDEYGRLVLLNVMDAVDDTVLVRKTVIAELQEDLLAVATHKSARSTLLHLLAPRQPRYLAPPLLACLPALDTATGDTTTADKATADTPAKKETGKKRVREEDDGEGPPPPPPGDPPGEGEEEEDGEEKEGEGATAVKKPIHVKRKELLGSGKGSLGVQLVEMCTENAGDMIRDVHLADTLVEVVRGGDGGLLVESASTAAFETLYEAIAAAANVEPEEEEEEEEEGKEGGEKTAKEHLLVDFWGSRMMRRLALTPPPPGVKSLANTLWAEVFKGQCKKWVGTHAEKVLAAVMAGCDAAATKQATTELAKLVEPSVEEWLQKFDSKKPTKDVTKSIKVVTKTPSRDVAKTPTKDVTKGKAKDDTSKSPVVKSKTPVGKKKKTSAS